MIDPEMRTDCPMRTHLGNCYPVGGFCMDAVSDEICKALHNAYDNGFYDAVRTLQEQYSCENCAIAIEDRQPVVRCGDCKHYKDGFCYNPNTYYDDEKTRGNTVPDWFCADGKKR